jgi:uncharacterized protein (DUF488 family)
MPGKHKNPVYTIGHGTRELALFIALLDSFAINQLVDIRTIPRSRHNPQYNFDTLPKELRSKKINYKHEKNLGGLRHAKKDSINLAWRNASFRGFADYMQTSDFSTALDKLITLSQKKTLAIMCAETLPWRCHRSLIADALLLRGIEVYDIFDLNKCRAHSLTPWAQVKDSALYYP